MKISVCTGSAWGLPIPFFNENEYIENGMFVTTGGGGGGDE